MATVKSFENLFCWQKARELTKFIYRITNNPAFSKDYGLKDQIRRAAVSVMSNIAEGFDRGTRLELINYFFIAKGSSGEVKCQLYIALDCGHINQKEFNQGYKLSEEASRLIQSFIKRVKTGSRSGLQYKMEQKKDERKELLKQYAPEMYKKLHPNE
ncbi:MAG: four helix bundle protein [Patescibacteria group bacterium]|nr:four helix bundle protein [Patescibacteria group bacterium]